MKYTIKEVAKNYGFYWVTVQRAAKQCFPDKIKKGVKSFFDDSEVEIILSKIQPKKEHYQLVKSIEGDTAIIDIDGYEVLIDKEDIEKVTALQWDIYLNKKDNNTYVVHYGFKNGKRKYKLKNVWLHKYLLGTTPKVAIDHVNKNTLDNRKTNLRVCNKDDYSLKDLEKIFGIVRGALGRRCVSLFPEKGGRGGKIYLTEREFEILKADINKPYTPEPHNIISQDDKTTVLEIDGYHVIIDTDSYELVSKYRWYKSISHDRVYFLYNRDTSKKKDRNSLHRTVMQAKKGEYVDHISGDTLDNRKCNLRICTNAENSRNSKIPKSNKSGYKGVLWIKEKRKWVSRIMYNRKNINLGYFNTPEEAYAAYCKAAKELHGEFARLA